MPALPRVQPVNITTSGSFPAGIVVAVTFAWGAGSTVNFNLSGSNRAGLQLGTNSILSANINVTGGTTNALQFIGFGNGATIAGNIFLGASSFGIRDDGGLNSVSQVTKSTTGTITLSGIISGTGALSGANNFTGTLVLSGANTYTGGSTVSTGTVKLNGAGTLGSTGGALTVTGGTLDLNGTNQGVGALTGTGGTILNNAAGTTSVLTVGNANGTGGSFTGRDRQSFLGYGNAGRDQGGNGDDCPGGCQYLHRDHDNLRRPPLRCKSAMAPRRRKLLKTGPRARR